MTESGFQPIEVVVHGCQASGGESVGGLEYTFRLLDLWLRFGVPKGRPTYRRQEGIWPQKGDPEGSVLRSPGLVC